MAFAAGYAAGVQTPGRFSAIGQALNQLLSMGFQAGEREKGQAFEALQTETKGKQALEQIGAQGEQSRMTAETTGAQNIARDQAKMQAGQEAIKNFTKFLAAGHATGPEFLRAGLEAGIRDLDGDGVLSQTEISQQMPAAKAEAGMAPGAAPQMPEGGVPMAPGAPAADFGEQFRGALGTPAGAAAFAQLEPSVQSGFKAAAEARESGDVNVLAQRALTDPDAALRLDKVLSTQVQTKVREDNARFNSIKGIEERATAMQEDVDQARQAYQGALGGKLDMMAALLGDKIPAGLLKGDPESQALAIRLAKEAYLTKASAYNAFLKKHKLEDMAEAGKGERDLATDPEAAKIREQVRAGTLTKEQGKAKLKAAGF